jgi:hypothetical protein
MISMSYLSRHVSLGLVGVTQTPVDQGSSTVGTQDYGLIDSHYFLYTMGLIIHHIRLDCSTYNRC